MSAKSDARADHRSIAGALPWYAAGTLDADERRELERHLDGCGECRERLAEIRRLAELGASASIDRVMEHVAPGLLVEYGADPDALDEATRREVEARLARCQVCRGAYDNLVKVEAALRSAESPAVDTDATAANWLDGLWAWMSGTLLRPAPALAYLLIAALGIPALWGLRESGDPATGVQVVAVGAERGQREGATTAPPLVVPMGLGADSLLLELQTDLVEQDLAGLDFVVELSVAGRVIWSEPRQAAAFVIRDGKAVLPLVLDPERAGRNRDLRIAIRAVRPGDPLDGQPLFARTLRIPGN